jgi:hypothetical protein
MNATRERHDETLRPGRHPQIHPGRGFGQARGQGLLEPE